MKEVLAVIGLILIILMIIAKVSGFLDGLLTTQQNKVNTEMTNTNTVITSK